MKPNDQELSAGDYAKASLLIIGAAASLAVGFTLIAACHAVGALNPFRKRYRKQPTHK